MNWSNPWLLFALAVPLAVAFCMSMPRRSRSRHRWTGLTRVAIAGRNIRLADPPRLRPSSLVLLAVSLTIVAASGPQWGERPGQSFSRAREVMIALDLSRSMLTEDVEPSRLELARNVTTQLLDRLQGESVGLVVFAGTAYVQVPRSPDYQIIEQFIPSLDPDYMPQGGSNYASMLDAALDGFSEVDDRDRFLVVLSDGESSTTGWESSLPELVDRRVRVLAIGIGSDEGGFIPDGWGGYLAGSNGNPVHSRLVTANLETLARRTRGSYRNGSELLASGGVQSLLAETVEAGRRGNVALDQDVVLIERFQWFLLPAVLLALLSLWREFRSRPKPRQVRPVPDAQHAERPVPPIRRVTTYAAIFLPVMLLSAANETHAHFDSEADFEVHAMFDSNPVERVRSIAEHLARFDYDAFDLRLLVEESIRYGQDAQRTGAAIERGVIRDAIDACVTGESIDASIADWSYYRAQLRDLLPPEDEAGDEGDKSRDRDERVDEEDESPVVTGQSSQQTAEDSFGRGAASETDATLGDLSAEKDETGNRDRRPPPGKARNATARDPSAGRNVNDPVLEYSRKRLEEIARRDSPGHLHQLLSEGTALENENEFDW